MCQSHQIRLVDIQLIGVVDVLFSDTNNAVAPRAVGDDDATKSLCGVCSRRSRRHVTAENRSKRVDCFGNVRQFIHATKQSPTIGMHPYTAAHTDLTDRQQDERMIKARCNVHACCLQKVKSVVEPEYRLLYTP